MILTFEGDINPVTAKTFLTELSQIPEDTPITLFLNSSGGEVFWANAILGALQERKHCLTLIAHIEISSSAFDIFFKYNGRRKIELPCIGMTHQVMHGVDYVGKRVTDGCKVRIKEAKLLLEECNDFLSALLSDKQLKRYNSGYDVHFTSKQLIKVLKKQNSLNAVQTQHCHYHAKENVYLKQKSQKR